MSQGVENSLAREAIVKAPAHLEFWNLWGKWGKETLTSHFGGKGPEKGFHNPIQHTRTAHRGLGLP